MKALFTSILLIFLSSCASIYFTEMQPKGAVMIKQFPNELCGEWYADGLKIVVTPECMTSTEWSLDSITMEIDTTIKVLNLDDTAFLTRSKPFYVYHYGEYGGPWEIALIEKKMNGDIVVYDTREPETYSVDKKLKLLKARYIIDEVDTILHTLNPDYEGSISFQSTTYSGQMKKKTLKKIAKPENIMYEFKNNGQFIPSKK